MVIFSKIIYSSDGPERPLIMVNNKNIPSDNRFIKTENSTLNLQCSVDSNPASLVTWYRRGSLLKSTTANSLEHTLQNIQCADSGMYFCTASNGIASSMNISVQLVVQCMYYYSCLELSIFKLRSQLTKSLIFRRQDFITYGIPETRSR